MHDIEKCSSRRETERSQSEESNAEGYTGARSKQSAADKKVDQRVQVKPAEGAQVDFQKELNEDPHHEGKPNA